MSALPEVPPRARRVLSWATLVTGAVTAGYFVAFKLGLVPSSAPLFALMVAGVSALLLLGLGLSVRDLIAAPRLAILGVLLVRAGILGVLGAGAANWAVGARGYLFLTEGEALPLSHMSELGELEHGPLWDARETDLVLELARIELSSGPNGEAQPTSHLVLRPPMGEPVPLTISRERGASFGLFRYFNGSFGYAPRIVLLRDGETIFDRNVLFTSQRRDGRVQFTGSVDLKERGLEVDASIVLESLDELLRGHPLLAVAVREKGTPVGEGRLRPGHFADLAGGLRVGFAGGKKWAEIDVARRAPTVPMLLGLLVLALGSALALVAKLRRAL